MLRQALLIRSLSPVLWRLVWEFVSCFTSAKGKAAYLYCNVAPALKGVSGGDQRLRVQRRGLALLNAAQGHATPMLKLLWTPKASEPPNEIVGARHEAAIFGPRLLDPSANVQRDVMGSGDPLGKCRDHVSGSIVERGSNGLGLSRTPRGLKDGVRGRSSCRRLAGNFWEPIHASPGLTSFSSPQFGAPTRDSPC